ncbi:MAG: mechanosensitive ion channel [Clostridiales bacterium]|nr:mechanosensitive ion channel [Clostridiales bacterium]
MLDNFNDWLTEYVPVILKAVIIIVAGYLLTKLLVKVLYRILDKTRLDHTAVTFILSVLKVFLYFIVAITALSAVGINVTSLITALGAAALTAGLALQDSLSNVASGIIILSNKPFVAGDIIEFEGIKGRVENIKIFYTTLHTLDNKLVTIPNSRLTANNVVNSTMVENRRVDLKYSISYDDDITKVKGLLYSLIATVDKILKNPEPAVYVGEHLDSGIEIIVQVWVNTDDYYDVYYYMQENVKRVFDENGVTIPYPHLVLKNEKDK